jgi:hypothetical protein
VQVEKDIGPGNSRQMIVEKQKPWYEAVASSVNPEIWPFPCKGTGVQWQDTSDLKHPGASPAGAPD